MTKPEDLAGTRETKVSKRFKIYSGVFAILLLALIYYTGPSESLQETNEKSWRVTSKTVELVSAKPSFLSYGEIASDFISDLTVDFTARVASVEVKEGDLVEIGQVLIRLEQDELALALKVRESELVQAESEYKSNTSQQALLDRTSKQHGELLRIFKERYTRAQELLKEKMISQAIFDEALQALESQTIEYEDHLQRKKNAPNLLAIQAAKVERAAALVERARLQLSKTVIVAPFSGPILKLQAAPGSTTTPHNPLITVADVGSVQVRTQIPRHHEHVIQASIQSGKPITASFWDNGQQQTLLLDRLAANIATGKSGLDAYFTPQNVVNFEIGRVVELTIHLPLVEDVVELPRSALYGKNSVFLVVDQRLREVEVEIVGEKVASGKESLALVRSPYFESGQQILVSKLNNPSSGTLVHESRSKSSHQPNI